jgi:hypothetical protein
VVAAAVLAGAAVRGLLGRGTLPPRAALMPTPKSGSGRAREAPAPLVATRAPIALPAADAAGAQPEAKRDPDEVPAWSPFARFERTREQRKVLYEAEEIAVASCMKAKGFEYEKNAFGIGPHLSRELPRYRPGDPQVASTIGYGLVEALEQGELPAPADANAAKVNAMPPERQRAWADALQGPPPPLGNEKASRDPNWVQIPTALGPTMRWYKGACFSQARHEVQGDEVTYAREELQVRSLAIEAQRKAQEDPDYQSGLEVWRGCMAAKGFGYRDSQAAVASLRSELETGRVTLDQLRAREIEVATADADCHQQANLTDAEDVARARAEAEVADRNRDVLDAFEQMQREALQRARQLLQSQPTQGDGHPATSG